MCMCAHVCICVYMCMCVHVCDHMCVEVCACVHVCGVRTCMCMGFCVHVHTSVGVCMQCVLRESYFLRFMASRCKCCDGNMLSSHKSQLRRTGEAQEVGLVGYTSDGNTESARLRNTARGQERGQVGGRRADGREGGKAGRALYLGMDVTEP